MPTISQELPAEPDLWAPVGFEHLPQDLVSAFRSGDWPQVRIRLQTVMDAMVTEGPYNRELFQLVLRLPLGLIWRVATTTSLEAHQFACDVVPNAPLDHHHGG